MRRAALPLLLLLTCTASLAHAASNTIVLTWQYRWEQRPTDRHSAPRWLAGDSPAGWQPLPQWGAWGSQRDGHDLWLRARLPATAERPALFCEDLPSQVEVYENGRLIDVWGGSSAGGQVELPGKHRLFLLSPSTSERWLMLKVSSSYPIHLVFSSEPRYGDSEALVTEHLRKHASIWAFGILFAVAAAAALAVGPFLPSRWAWIQYGMLAAWFSLLSFDHAGAFTLISSLAWFRADLFWMLLPWIGIWLPGLLAHLLPESKNQKRWRWLRWGHLIAFGAVVLLAAGRVVAPAVLHRIVLPLTGIGALAILALSFPAIRRSDREIRGLAAAGVWPFLLSLLVGIAGSLSISYGVLPHVLPWGFAAFTLALVVFTGRHALRAFRTQTLTEAVHQSESRFRALSENATDMVFLLDAAGQYLFVSSSCESETGLPPSRYYGTALFDRIHPEDQEQMRRGFRTLCASPRKTMRFEYRHETADGRWAIHEARATNQIDHPDVGGIVMNVRDITLRRQAEQALRDSEARMRVVFANLPMSVWAVDRDERLVLENDTAIREWGNHVGKRLDEVVEHTEVIVELKPHLARAFTGEVVTYEGGYQRGGRTQYVLNTLAPIQEGTVIRGVLGITIDLTERKMAEERQRRLETERAELAERLHLILSQLPIGCILGDMDFRFTYWNPAAEQIFGFTFDEVRGKHPFGVITPPQTQAYVASIFDRLKAGSGPIKGIGLNITKDGKLIRCEWHNVPFRAADGSFQGILSICQEVADGHHAQEQLRSDAT